MKKLILFSICWILSYSISFAQENIPTFISQDLDSYINKAIKDWQVPGLALAIVKDGKVIVSKGYGVKDMNSQNPVDQNTLFMIASNTKAFVGTSLAQLDHQNKLNLSDQVSHYLPQFKMHDPNLTDYVTLTDLVTHRMGYETFQGDFMYIDSNLSHQDVYEKFALLTPKYDFRTKWGYSNAGYLFAGDVIQKVSGQSWDQYIKTHFLEPLEMHNTYLFGKEIQTAQNKAFPHSIIDNKLQRIPFGHMDLLAPAGGMVSSVEDMTHWLIAQTSNGQYKNQEVIHPEIINKTRTPYSILGTTSFPHSSYRTYGLGWLLQDFNGDYVVSHTGGIDGFVSTVAIVPNKNLALVILTNSDENSLYQALKWDIINSFYEENSSKTFNDRYLKNAAQDQEENYQKSQKLKEIASQKIKLPLDTKQFTGTYISNVYGKAWIKKKKDHFELTLEHHPQVKASMHYIGDNTFLVDYKNPLLRIKEFPFKIKEGKVEGFTLSVASFLEFTTYDFKKL